MYLSEYVKEIHASGTSKNGFQKRAQPVPQQRNQGSLTEPPESDRTGIVSNALTTKALSITRGFYIQRKHTILNSHAHKNSLIPYFSDNMLAEAQSAFLRPHRKVHGGGERTRRQDHHIPWPLRYPSLRHNVCLRLNSHVIAPSL